MTNQSMMLDEVIENFILNSPEMHVLTNTCLHYLFYTFFVLSVVILATSVCQLSKMHVLTNICVHYYYYYYIFISVILVKSR